METLTKKETWIFILRSLLGLALGYGLSVLIELTGLVDRGPVLMVLGAVCIIVGRFTKISKGKHKELLHDISFWGHLYVILGMMELIEFIKTVGFNFS